MKKSFSKSDVKKPSELQKGKVFSKPKAPEKIEIVKQPFTAKKTKKEAAN